jgi:hypothetical protein
MKNTFHDYFFGLTVRERVGFAKRVGTSRAYLTAVAGGFKFPSVEMATRIILAANKKTAVNLQSGNTLFLMAPLRSGFSVAVVEPGNDQ